MKNRTIIYSTMFSMLLLSGFAYYATPSINSEVQKVHSGRITYRYTVNNRTQIREYLRKKGKLGDTIKYKSFNQGPIYSEEIWITEFKGNKSRSFMFRDEKMLKQDSIDRANNQDPFDPNIIKTGTLVNWIETIKGTVYNIEETLGTADMLPYEASLSEDATSKTSFLGIKVRKARLKFNMTYPNSDVQEFNILYADKIKGSAGPFEFFPNNKVVLKAESIGSDAVKFEAIKFEDVEIDDTSFSFPSHSQKISMHGFHEVIGYE